MNKTAIRRPAVRYHGGKWKLAPRIMQFFPAHRVYVESFGGGGALLLRKTRSYAEVYNDAWGVIVNVFRVLRDHPGELERRIRLTPYSRDEFNDTGDDVLTSLPDPIERARRTILRSFAGFGSASTNAKHSTGFRSNSNRSGTTPAHDWQHYPDYIKAFAERLQGVVIENKSALAVIADHDGVQTLHYVDPPYLHSTRNMQRGNAAYAHEMSEDDHHELGRSLNRVKGKVIVSGYPCALYDRKLFKAWRRVELRAFADGARPRLEVLYMNFDDADLFAEVSR